MPEQFTEEKEDLQNFDSEDYIEENKEDCKSRDALSSNYADCACGDLLAPDPVVYLTKDNKKVCRHFFHLACYKHLLKDGVTTCFFCHKHFDGSIQIPNMVEDPEGWFAVAKSDESDNASYRNILELLGASMHLDHRRLEAELPDVFKKLDTDGDGCLSLKEMMAETGLVAYAKDFIPKPQDFSKIPNIRTDSRKWFLFWDEDKNGRLDQEEVVRALLKTFFRGKSLDVIREFHQIVQALWPDMDLDGSMDIDHKEFTSPTGLYQYVVANLIVYGEDNPPVE